MPRRRTGQLPVPGLRLVGGACPLAAAGLLRPATQVETPVKGAFGQGRQTLLGTRTMVGTVDRPGMGLRGLLE